MDDLRVICARVPGNELISAECQNLAGGQPDQTGVARCRSVDEIPRSAYLSLGLRCLAQADSLPDIAFQVSRLPLSADRFRIELLRLDTNYPISEPEAVTALAEAIRAAPDLEAPLHRFLVVAARDCLWFGEILAASGHTYRKHDSKPYHITSGLPSRLARALVNLVSPPAGSILDPFCGAGSILLEAAALGLPAYGLDISPKLAGMSRRNLEHFGYPAHIERGDALDCRQPAGAVVTDLPYGRILSIDPARLLAILQNLRQLAPVAVFLAESDLTPLLESAGYRDIEVYRVPKRRGMVRYVHKVAINKFDRR